MISNVNEQMMPVMLQLLEEWPANGKPPEGDVTLALIVLGFVERCEQQKSCKECGKPRHDYSYLKITSAGRYFMAAMRFKVGD